MIPIIRVLFTNELVQKKVKNLLTIVRGVTIILLFTALLSIALSFMMRNT